MNTYFMLEDLRSNVGESTASHWTDAELLRKLNMAQRKVALDVSMAPGDWLVTSADITPSNSVITLPSDFSKPVYMEVKATGEPIPIDTSLRERRMYRATNITLETGYIEAYVLHDTIEINRDNYATGVTLWYEFRVPDLHTGTASAGEATSLTFDTTDGSDSTGVGGRLETDYYNNSKIEIISGTGAGIDTITEYSVARVATVAGTYSTDSVYGTVSKLPEECHHLIILEATTMAIAKPSSAIDPKYFEYFTAEKKESWKNFKTWIGSRVKASNYVRGGG